MFLRTAKVAAIACLMATGASAATITFDTSDDCVSKIVTIVAGPNSTDCVVSQSPVGSNALVKGGASASFWFADFSDLVDSVSVELGDFGGDADELFLATLDISGALSGLVTEAIDQGVSGMHTLSLNVANISTAVFGVTGRLGGGGVYADNLTFNTQVSAVPVPASALLFGTALAGLGAMRRRKTS